MYVGCSGETYVYTCCNIGRARICGKNMFLALGFAKKDLKSTYGNGKIPFVQDCMG
jgi:hypothetical protein